METPKIQIVNWHPSLTISRPYLKKNADIILSCLGLNGSGVEVTLVDDAFMRRQNVKFRHNKGTTDVLSFAQLEVAKKNIGAVKVFRGRFLGDVLICLDQARRQAKSQKLAIKKEVLFLLLHAILHLIGYDHHNNTAAIKMQKVESSIWRQIINS